MWDFPPLLGCVVSLGGERWDSVVLSGVCEEFQEGCAGCVTTVLLLCGCGEQQLPLVFSVTLLGKLCVSFWAALCLSEWWLPAIKKDPFSVCYTAGIQQKGHKNCWSTCPEACWSPSPSQWWRGAIQPDFVLRAAFIQKPCGYSSSPFKLLTCPVKLCSLALLKWDWRQTCK